MVPNVHEGRGQPVSPNFAEKHTRVPGTARQALRFTGLVGSLPCVHSSDLHCPFTLLSQECKIPANPKPPALPSENLPRPPISAPGPGPPLPPRPPTQACAPASAALSPSLLDPTHSHTCHGSQPAPSPHSHLRHLLASLTHCSDLTSTCLMHVCMSLAVIFGQG